MKCLRFLLLPAAGFRLLYVRTSYYPYDIHPLPGRARATRTNNFFLAQTTAWVLVGGSRLVVSSLEDQRRRGEGQYSWSSHAAATKFSSLQLPWRPKGTSSFRCTVATGPSATRSPSTTTRSVVRFSASYSCDKYMDRHAVEIHLSVLRG